MPDIFPTFERMGEHDMKLLKIYGTIFLVSVFISACSIIAPRVSSWDSPKGFTKMEVFNAALQAGKQSGMDNTSSDQEKGTMTFYKPIGKGGITQSLHVRDDQGIVNVQTTNDFYSSHFGDTPIGGGLHEEVIRKFHIFLFRNLNILDPSAKEYRIEKMK